MPTDWMLNWSGKSGRIRCHQDADLVWGKNRDWSRVSGDDYLLQKLKLYFGIPHGEVLNDPSIGCCLHNYLFDTLTSESLLAMGAELEYELKDQLPELGVQSVYVAAEGTNAVRLRIDARDRSYIIPVSKEDLLAFSLIDTFRDVTT